MADDGYVARRMAELWQQPQSIEYQEVCMLRWKAAARANAAAAGVTLEAPTPDDVHAWVPDPQLVEIADAVASRLTGEGSRA